QIVTDGGVVGLEVPSDLMAGPGTLVFDQLSQEQLLWGIQTLKRERERPGVGHNAEELSDILMTVPTAEIDRPEPRDPGEGRSRTFMQPAEQIPHRAIRTTSEMLALYAAIVRNT